MRRYLVTLVAAALVDHLDADPDEYLPEDHEWPSKRQGWGLTTDYDGTVNNDAQGRAENGG